ncbi:MAG: outer membrane protein transport protein [Tateyamaria sp.]|uniref:OmpP1/FadL family transporter n=1 Tax=Tateyamaria sp. TaxID=1929288 RepID=UPI00329F1985
MKYRVIAASAALVASSSAAYAVGLDRSTRPTGLIFESGNILEFSLGFSEPSIDGTDFTPPVLGGPQPTGNIAESFVIWGIGVRYEVNDQFSVGLIVDEPYGADILYGPSSTLLGGTAAKVDSSAITAFGRYKFDHNWSVHGGLIYQNISANVTLSGLAYGGISGYNAAFSNDSAVGYMVGAAYEIPEIALRIALTYHSEIDHELDTFESVGPSIIGSSTTEVTTPETIELAVQSGIAQDTLLFGSVRFSHYSATTVSPIGLQTITGNPNASLTDLENAWDAEIGIGRRFNDKWSGSVSIGWEQKGEDDFVSPLGSTNGATFLTVGAAYQLNESTKISGGIRYTDFGNATPNVGGTAVGSFEGDSAISAGLRIQYSF